MKIEHRANGVDLHAMPLTAAQNKAFNEGKLSFHKANPRSKLVVEWDFLLPIIQHITEDES